MRLAVARALLLPLLALGSCKAPPQSTTRSDALARVSASPSSPAASPSSASPAPAICHDNTSCNANEYCEFKPGLCGKGQTPGTCRAKPTGCTTAYDPVCACSGKVYDNACSAHTAGEDLAVMGGCKAVIPNFAACGTRYCDAHVSYCEIYLSDVFELPTDHFCQPLPEACKPGPGAPATCECFPPNTPCLSFCGPLATGGIDAFHLTCQGKRPQHS
jgi:hypothetical protein